MTLNNDALIKKDRLRFTKNKLSASLTYLAIVANALYFVNIYSSDVGTYYYKWLIGVSVLYNLVFMLISFLASEGVKNYNLGYGYTLVLLGAGQIARIFILPLSAHTDVVDVTVGDQVIQQTVMSDGQFILVLSYLIASAALCVIAGAIAIIKTTTLRSYEAELARRGGKI